MSQRIFVVSPDEHLPSGGIKQLYRHVDVLSKNGYEAKILHRKKGYRCTWFENSTPTTSWDEITWKDSDIIVLPEIFGPHSAERLIIRKARRIYDPKRYWIKDLPPLRKVIFNQNAYNTFMGNAFDPKDLATPYRDPLVVATIVVSDDNKEYILSVFPHLTIHRIHNAINPKLFVFHREKKNQICFMPRKHRDEAEQVLNIAKYHGAMEGYTVVPIDNASESEVARIMKESLFFLSFGYPEGCPLPPAEAMASGCIVIGYHGWGGREYFLPAHSFPVEAADVRTFARILEEVIGAYPKNAEPFDRMRAAASKFITDTYSPKREEDDICHVWRSILGENIS